MNASPSLSASTPSDKLLKMSLISELRHGQTGLARSRPCSYPPLQQPARLPRGMPSGPERSALAAWMPQRGCGVRSGACPKPLIPLAPEHTQVLRVRTASRELDDMKVIEHDEAHRVRSKLWSTPSEPSERVDRLLAMAQVLAP